VEKVEGQGSVWNTGSYFWEEKSVGKWADERLKEILGVFRHAFPGGELKVTEVSDFKGESSVSIRKGKKIVNYDYNCKLKWELVLRDGEGTEVGKLTGTYELPEVSNDIDDDGEDWEVRTSFGEDANNIKARVDGVVRKDATNVLRKEIKSKFVTELKLK
jgi:activator of HSP90 ATPase